MQQETVPATNPHLVEFFNAVAEAAQPFLSARAAEANRKAEAEAEAEAPARIKHLTNTVTEELGGVLTLLAGLPAKDGKKFFVDTEAVEVDAEGSAYGAVTVSHRAVNSPKSDSEESSWNFSVIPALRLRFRETAGKPLWVGVTRMYKNNPKSKEGFYERQSLTGFDAARREVAQGVASFALERVADIGKALGGAAAAQLSPLNL